MDQPLAPLNWLVPDYFLCGYINTLASLPGEGKTALVTSLVWQVSRPKGMFLEHPVQSGNSLYVDFDAPGDGRSVRFWLNKHRHRYPDGDLNKIKLLEPDEHTYNLGEPELEQIMVAAIQHKAKLIVLDAFSSAFPSTDPSKLNQVQIPLWHLRRLATTTQAAVLVLDHLPKPHSGEQAGARGVLGSVMKSAQARAVHILSRIPHESVGERHVLRWDCYKLSYGARPPAFGVEILTDETSFDLRLTSLPNQTESRTDRAVWALCDYLERNRGVIVMHQTLIELAKSKGKLRDRAAAEVVRRVKTQYGDALKEVTLQERGSPKGYYLEDPEQPASPRGAAILQQTTSETSMTEKHYMQLTLPQTPNLAKDS